MVNKSASALLAEFDRKGILSRTDYTFTEYVDALCEFQRVAGEMFYGDDSTGIRMTDIIAKMKVMAKEQGISYSSDIYNAIKALQNVDKDIAVMMAGKRGEDRVANMFQYVTRPEAKFFRNIYLTDGLEETEADAVILTSNGILVLEIKNAKSDITLSTEGRILFGNTCYHDISIGEKIGKKVMLLKKRIEKGLDEKGLDAAVNVEGMLVFSTPNGVRIHVTNLYHQVNYCFRSNLFNRVDSFNSGVCYSEMELEALTDVLEEAASVQKRYESNIDLAETRYLFAKACEVLGVIPEYEEERSAKESISIEKAEEIVATDVNEDCANKILCFEEEQHLKRRKNRSLSRNRILKAAASVVAIAAIAVSPLVGSKSVMTRVVADTMAKMVRS